MKELSIEQKAKRYDESIKKLRDFYRDYDTISCLIDVKDELANLFPELKEYEGERIRNVLIGWINLEPSTSFNDTFDGFSKEQILAWLEKQEDKDSQVKLPTFTFDDILALQCCMETVKKVQEDKDLYEKLNDLHGRVYDAYHLEKQGESIDKITQRARTEKQRVILTETNGEANIDWDTRSIQDVKLLLEYGLDYIKKLENQGEQNPADKAEPKFKVGDWCIDNEDGIVFQIVKVLDNTYKYRTNEGKEYSCTHYSLELDARLWSIEDAKPGAVLAAHECLVLFREIDGLNIKCHCTYHFMNHESFFMNTLQNKTAFQPATKEQCDLLFQKMKEEGYEWNAEKKELKEIEDEPNKCEGCNNVKGCIACVDGSEWAHIEE